MSAAILPRWRRRPPESRWWTVEAATGGPAESAEQLGLLGIELGIGDDSLGLEIGQFRQFVHTAARGAGSLLHVGIEGLLLLCRLGLGAFVHLAAAGDQVHEDAEEREDDHEDHPQGLCPSAEVAAPEDVREHDDEEPE